MRVVTRLPLPYRPPVTMVRGGVCVAAVVVLATALAALPRASGLYFHIQESETKCFIEEVPDETMIVGQSCADYRETGSHCVP